MMQQLLAFNRKHLAACTTAGSALALATAYTAQYGFGLLPCSLCLYQRLPYWAGLGLACAAILLLRNGRAAWARVCIGLAGLGFFIGAGIAAFHVGVEQHWWTGFETCVGPTGAATVDELLAQITNTPVVRCDEVAWSLFGVSMTAFNLAYGLALAAMVGLGLRSTKT